VKQFFKQTLCLFSRHTHCLFISHSFGSFCALKARGITFI
jgi:hypothetical protein